MSTARVEAGDNLAVMPELWRKGVRVDAVVTDPPYGIGFMGKRWDKILPDRATWKWCFRLLKPGGFMLAFSSTRTYHRLACDIEDAGFEVFDQFAWMYGSGFAKVGYIKEYQDEWAGCGGSVKPAWEPIAVVRKPFKGSLLANLRRHGTGALNIDGCRVAGDVPSTTQTPSANAGEIYGADQREKRTFVPHDAGRWPSNVVHDGSPEVLAAFGAYGERGGQLGGQTSADDQRGGNRVYAGGWKSSGNDQRDQRKHNDDGTAARFFYSAKASEADRAGSRHPTVKPIDLIAYYARMVTPPGGTLLDPFAGSGTAIEAGLREGLDVIAIEREPEYVADCQRRIDRITGADTPLLGWGAE